MYDFLLMAAPGGANQNPIATILPFALIAVVFYFFMIRPQAKKMKDQKSFVEKLSKGDRVITHSGIHGKIVESDPAYFILEVDHNVRMKFEKSAVSLELSAALNKAEVVKS